jgi:hypothetical protein
MLGALSGLFGGGGQGGFMSQPYGDWRTTSGEGNGNPNLAGRYSDIVKEYQDLYGTNAPIDPKDPMSVAMNLIKNQQMQTSLSNDPRIVGMQAQAYVDPMNQLADKASERGAKGRIFALQEKLPYLYAEAMARKFDFINPVIEEMRANRTKRFQDSGGSILKFNV